MSSILDEYKNIVGFFAESLGNMYEVFVLEYADNELKPCDSNYVDEESVKKLFPFVMQCIENDKPVVNKAVEFETGKLSKVSVYTIRDENGCIAGVICISLKCGPFFKLERLVNEFLCFNMQNEEMDKNYPSTLEGIENYINDFGLQSEKPDKHEKSEIILDLYEMGMFNIKGAVALVADRLQMSPKSVYRYLSKIKEIRE